MNRRVLEYLREQDMLHPGDHVICAVSGGKDSMAMLHVLYDLAPKLDIKLSAAHLNHRLRGAESQRDADFVAAHCQALGIPCLVDEADVSAYAADHGIGMEEAARTLRYDFLKRIDPTAKIATAHTAEDNLETVLMHLLRGSGLHGLSGIPPVRGQIIRPLLSVSRAQIETYLNQKDIPHVEDSTNASDDYLRNRLRHHVLPLLLEENPSLPESVFHLTQTLRLEDDFLAKEANSRLSNALEHGCLSRRAFLSQSPAMQYRMLQRFLAPVSDLTRRHLDAAYRLCLNEDPSASISLPGGCTLRREYEFLRLLPPEPPKSPLLPVEISEGIYPFGPWQITCRRSPAPTVLPKGTVALAAAHLTAPLQLRPYQSGDRIRLPGGTKKLSRLYIDQKIPAHLRSAMPVAVVGDTIAAALPLRAARDFSPKPGEESLLLYAVKMED